MLIWIFSAATVALLAWSAAAFNRLISLRNRSRGAWSDIDVQLKRRHDLVGNLVRVVEGYARHERETLREVVEARDGAEGARGAARPGAAGEAESVLSGRLRMLIAVAEAYPELKSSKSFLELQQTLIEVEDDLQNARRYHNAVVRDLNTRIQSFPDLLVAILFRFKEGEFFRLEDPSEAIPPRVDRERT